MTGIVSLIVAAAAMGAGGLPHLPERGLALETGAGIQLRTLSGRRLVTVRGLDIAFDKTTAHSLLMRDSQGRLFTLDLVARRIRRVYERPRAKAGCRRTDTQLFVCGRSIRSASGLVARAPGKVGHWVWAERSPGGDAVLAQWSGECEIPAAWLIARGRMASYGAETVALGWLPSGEALIHFRTVGCAAAGRSGIYAVSRRGTARLVLHTKRFSQYAMWGG